MASDVGLEDVRAPLRQFSNGIGRCRRGPFDRRLINKLVTQSAERQGKKRNDRRSGA
jgi:hypothetical protein